MVAPALCGGFLSSKRSVVAFTWTITTVLTLVAFLMAIVLTIQIHTHYKRMGRSFAVNDDLYQSAYGNNNNNNDNGDGHNNNNNNHDNEGNHEAKEKYKEALQQAQLYDWMASLSSKSVIFVSVYTMTLALALALYGSTAIVGFTSLRGVYIAPCFSSPSKLKVGIFGGAIIIFANLLLVCAVIFGEVRVFDFRDSQNGEEREPYALERIATVLAVTCMFLSALYTVFAILLFLCYANEGMGDSLDPIDEGVTHTKPLVAISSSPDGFITMENSSS